MPQPEPFTPEELARIDLAKRSFPAFLDLIYPHSFPGRTWKMADGYRYPFTLGAVHYSLAESVQLHPRGAYLLPRGHLKSTVLNHGLSFWKLFRGAGVAGGDMDGRVFSYNDRLAREHVEKTKKAIAANPYCRFWVDRKPNAESLIEYEVRFDLHPGWLGMVDPFGIMSAGRGGHPKFVICDDILTDPQKPVDSAEIKYIDNVFKGSLESMPEEDETLVVVGTPQSYEDTLYRLRQIADYFWARIPATWDTWDGRRCFAWPEKYNEPRLIRIKKRLKGTFQTEFMLVPYLAVNSYLPREIVELCVVPNLQPANMLEPFYDPHNMGIYGGMDVGKEVHPTHIVLLMQTPTKDLVEIYERFVEGMPYNEQALLVNKLIKHFNVRRFVYDNTRAEMDDRNMSRRAIGQKFTKKLKAQIALQLEHRFWADPEREEPTLVLLPDKRQVDQIVAVDRELKSIETSGGHGDSFWSLALAVEAAKQGPVMVEIGNAQDMFSPPQRRRSGLQGPPLAIPGVRAS